MQATPQAASNRTPVEVKDLWKSFGAQKVLNGIGLQVSLGQIVAVLGRSGTGKSVLLKLLAGLQPADSGSIQIAGGEITHLDLAPLNEIRKKMGFLFQQAALYDSLTVAQNVDSAPASGPESASRNGTGQRHPQSDPERLDRGHTNRGLMGDEYVELSVGADDSPPVKPGDTLTGAAPIQVSDLLRKASGILDSANGAVQNISQTAGQVDSIASKINKGSGTIGALVNDKQVNQNVNQATAEMKEDMEVVKHNFLSSHFFKKRGYEDAADLTKHQIARLPPEPAVKEFSWNGSRIFDRTDTARLKDSRALKQAGEYLQANPFGLAVVAGYADKGGTDEDKILTEARAMVVRDYLVKNFNIESRSTQMARALSC